MEWMRRGWRLPSPPGGLYWGASRVPRAWREARGSRGMVQTPLQPLAGPWDAEGKQTDGQMDPPRLPPRLLRWQRWAPAAARRSRQQRGVPGGSSPRDSLEAGFEVGVCFLLALQDGPEPPPPPGEGSAFTSHPAGPLFSPRRDPRSSPLPPGPGAGAGFGPVPSPPSFLAAVAACPAPPPAGSWTSRRSHVASRQ